MNKIIIIVAPFVFIILLFIILYSFGYIGFRFPGTSPKRLDNIPPTAVWHGGIDGGMWFDVLNIQDSIYHIKIYMDNSGRLVEDGDFIADKNATRDIKNNGDIKKMILFYSEEGVYLESSDEHNYNILKKVRSYKKPEDK